MTDQRDEQLQRLAQALRSTQVQPDDPLRRLAEALVADDSYSHQQAEQDLPGYVNTALLGQPVAQQYPALHRHLLNCRQCAALHVAMLEDLTTEPAGMVVPQPDLSFLPGAYFRRLRSAVLRLNQAIAEVIRPALLPSLAGMADILFDELEELGPELWAQPATSGGHAFDEGGGPEEVRLLAATWAATRQLGEQRTAQQMDSLQQSGAWTEIAQQTAAQAAANLGFKRDQTARFAQEYARLVALNPSVVPVGAQVGSHD
jgi:hypothetical protein